jgi:hypothetical protein
MSTETCPYIGQGRISAVHNVDIVSWFFGFFFFDEVFRLYIKDKHRSGKVKFIHNFVFSLHCKYGWKNSVLVDYIVFFSDGISFDGFLLNGVCDFFLKRVMVITSIA